MRTIFLDLESVDQNDLDLTRLRQVTDQWQSYPYTQPQQLRQRCHDAQIIISNKVVLDRETLQQLPALKLVCVAATGTNNVDIQAAADLGIAVCHVRRYATASVCEHVFALALTLTRRLTEYGRHAIDGSWENSKHFCVLGSPIGELQGAVLGIIGYGDLGKRVHRLAGAIGMRTLISQRPGQSQPDPQRTPLHQVVEQADVLTLHCPLTPQTRGLINYASFQSMKRSSILINTARGGIVVEEDLLRALNEGLIAGAALDVLDTEPPLAGHPLLTNKPDNLIITPHVAWASRRARQNLVDELVKNIESFLKGKVRNAVLPG